MTYLQEIIDETKLKNPNEPEYHQAVEEIITSIEPVIASNDKYKNAKIIERIVEPERQIIF